MEGGRLIGGRLIEVGLYFFSLAMRCYGNILLRSLALVKTYVIWLNYSSNMQFDCFKNHLWFSRYVARFFLTSV